MSPLIVRQARDVRAELDAELAKVVGALDGAVAAFVIAREAVHVIRREVLPALLPDEDDEGGGYG